MNYPLAWLLGSFVSPFRNHKSAKPEKVMIRKECEIHSTLIDRYG